VYPEYIFVEFNLGLDIELEIKKEIPQNITVQNDNSMVNLIDSDTQNLCALNGGEGALPVIYTTLFDSCSFLYSRCGYLLIIGIIA